MIQTSGHQGPQALLLVLGPDAETLKDLVTMLSTKLYRASIETCTTASEALDRIQRTDYDVVLSDVAIFGPHGLIVMEQIKQIRPQTPTLLLTARDDRPLTVRALGAGAYAVIIKPADPDYLAASVKRAVQMRHLVRQVEEQKLALERHADELERLVADRTEELSRKDREQQVIFNSVPAMIWYKDRYNRILRVNEPAATSIGLKVEEVEGKSTYDLYPDEAAQYHKDDLDVIASGKPKLGIIEPYQTGQGYKRWVRTDKVPYRDETGTVVGVIVFAVDITDCLDRFARRLGEKGSRRDRLQGQA
jgi:PAS domain S-box-containing protein